MSEPFERRDALFTRPIRSFGLTIAGSRLEPIVAEFLEELAAKGLSRVTPRFYLSSEWGVPDGTIAIAIPFYLASDELTAIHAARAGHVEGRSRSDILRYLRHEMGHVVNYAFRLYETAPWESLFGPMSRHYQDHYQPVPFSREYVRHLPGWYAQKHPDEDWAETFAVWMTPGLDWRTEYADWPVALAKLEYCDRSMAHLVDVSPDDVISDLDEDVSEIAATLDDFYQGGESEPIDPSGLDGALRTIFDEPGGLAAGALIRRLRGELGSEVYRWTGMFPERVGSIVDLLVDRADALGLTYPEAGETSAMVSLTAFLTALASSLGNPS